MIFIDYCPKVSKLFPVNASFCDSRTHADCCLSMLFIRVTVSFRMQQSQSHHPTLVSSQSGDVLVRLQPVSELHLHPSQDLRQPCTHGRAEKRQVHSRCLCFFLLRTPPTASSSGCQATARSYPRTAARRAQKPFI